MSDAGTAARLAEVAFFSGLSTEEVERLAQQVRVEHVPAGTLLAEEGELSSKFMIVLDGHVTVHRAGHHVTDLGAGDVFGEAGTVQLQPRNATVISTTRAEIATLMGWDLRDLLARSPAVRDRAEAIVAERAAD
jgi:CRP-like cAMP-binding protein